MNDELIYNINDKPVRFVKDYLMHNEEMWDNIKDEAQFVEIYKEEDDSDWIAIINKDKEPILVLSLEGVIYNGR